MNERNVCIGDIISFGPEVQLQVSLPRMPCFKLNHRFSLKNFAPETYKFSRTGWYYRVVREGTVRAGDDIRLVERKHPNWTIERIQEYLHRDKDNLEMNKQLADIEALGEESRGQFRNRVAKATSKKKPKVEDKWKDFKVKGRKMETQRVVSLTLEAVEPDPDAEYPLHGSHARIKLPNGLVRTYSVVAGEEGKPALSNQFELGIALEEQSRGGSRYLHERAKVGHVLQVGRITTDVNPNGAASNHVFIAGGIGITAFLALIKAMENINWSCKLHYAVRSDDDVPFTERLKGLKDGTVVIYDKSKGERMDVDNIVRTMPWNSHLYVCGPSRMMEAAKQAVDKGGIPPNEVHYEAFAADISGDPFEVEIANKGSKVLQVGEEESLLEVLRKEYPDAASSCEVGNCGTCKIAVKSGRVDHRGTALLPEDKETAMLACVSRGIGRLVVEI